MWGLYKEMKNTGLESYPLQSISSCKVFNYKEIEMEEIFFMEGMEREIPAEILAEMHAWSESTLMRLELAKEFGKGRDYKVAHLDAVDWLFFSDTDTPGSFGFVLDLMSMAFGYEIEVEAAREALLKNSVFRNARQRFDALLDGHLANRKSAGQARWKQMPLLTALAA